MFFLVSTGFQPHEVADYERKRYRGLDQRLVNAREMRILRKFLSLCSPAAAEDFRSGAEGPVRALDAPCGYGRFAGLLGEAGFAVFATDLSVAMVRRARAHGPDPTYSIGIVSNLTQGLPFKTGSFSLVFSMRFFHHLHESAPRRAALAEFARASREWLILSYYQANPLHLAQRALRRKVLRKKTRIKMISGREFREEAETSGFEVVRVVPLFRGIHAQHIALLRKTGF
jgi:SAM-dependent methyltransferase